MKKFIFGTLIILLAALFVNIINSEADNINLATPTISCWPYCDTYPTNTITSIPIPTDVVQKFVFLPMIFKSIPPTPTPTATNTSTPTKTRTLIPTATNVPTQIPIITKTPTPTNVPVSTSTNTPMSTISPFGVQILSNHSYYIDSIGYLHIIGEVQNNTSNYLRFIQITVNLFDINNILVDTDFTYIFLDSLPPYTKACFHNLMSPPPMWSHYQFENPTYYIDGQPLPNLAVLNVSSSSDYFGGYKIIGQVRNDQGSRVEYVSPLITVYNNAGIVLGCDFTFVNSTHLDPNQISSFTDTFSNVNYSDVSSYHIQVDGNIK